MSKKISEFFKQTPKSSKIYSSNSNQGNIKDSSKNSEDDENICKFCGIAYLNLSMHIKKVHQGKVKKYFCKICDSKFTQKSNLNYHIKNIHTIGQSEKFECDFDGKIFKSKGRLYDHMKSHLPDVECHICHKSLKFISLKLHLKATHATDQNLKCKICLKMFKSASHLHKHEKTHNKKFQCKICKSMQSTQGRLNEHIKLKHKNAEIYKCETCEREFKLKDSLNKHQKTHNKNRPKPFKCHRCDYATDKKQHYDGHQNSHERQDNKIAAMKNPIKCEKCPTLCKNKKALWHHMSQVHPKDLYQCDLCAKFIKIKKNFITHMNAHILKKS